MLQESKGKIVPVHAIKSCRRHRGIAPLIVISALDGGEFLTPCFAHCTARERTPVSNKVRVPIEVREENHVSCH